ncbi:MAG: hypothetical protein ACI4Q7_05240 [Candidatus Avelusimicrobium sp.]
MKTIVSTLSNDQKYTVYKALPGGGFAVSGQVLVKGGANVADKVTLRSPEGGVFTQVTDEEYAILERCPQFAAHKQAGFVYVTSQSDEIAAAKEAKKAAKNLKKKDESAQLTPEDFTKAGKKAPTSKAAGK